MKGVGDILSRMVSILTQAGIAFMVGRSFASTIHGTARATRHIDVIIEPASVTAFETLLAGFATDEYYIDIDTARRTFRLGGMFNVIDNRTGWKIDFILRKDRPFSIAEFARRSAAQIHGSSRQRLDVSGIVAVVAADLDQEYLQYWIGELGLQSEWAAANAMSEQNT